MHLTLGTFVSLLAAAEVTFAWQSRSRSLIKLDLMYIALVRSTSDTNAPRQSSATLTPTLAMTAIVTVSSAVATLSQPVLHSVKACPA